MQGEERTQKIVRQLRGLSIRNEFPFYPETQSQDFKKTVTKSIIVTEHTYTESPYCALSSVRYWGYNDEPKKKSQSQPLENLKTIYV